MHEYVVCIEYSGVIEVNVEAQDIEEAEFMSQDIATIELPPEVDEYTISVLEI